MPINKSIDAENTGSTATFWVVQSGDGRGTAMIAHVGGWMDAAAYGAGKEPMYQKDFSLDLSSINVDWVAVNSAIEKALLNLPYFAGGNQS